MPHFEIAPTPEVEEELKRIPVSFRHIIDEAVGYLNDPDVDDPALARMYIERGYSEELSYWLVREANMRHAPQPK